MSGMSVQPFTQNPLGWIVVVVGTIATLATILASFYWMLRPGERDPDHPKYMVLKKDR
jgi:hypothetical protein